MALTLNEPTPEGIALGAQLARLCDGESPAFEAAHPEVKARCGTCAFRAGTLPNGCAVTLLDALKCSMEGVPFMCHEDLRLCTGYLLMKSNPPITAPWPFSYED
jgi:hypothetical protein